MAKGLLGTSFDDPRTRANLAIAMGLLEAGGPSPVPVSLGQGIGRAGMLGVQAYDEAKASQQKVRADELSRRLTEARIAGLEFDEAEKRRRATALGQLQLTTDPETRRQKYFELFPEQAIRSEIEAAQKPPATITSYDPKTGQTKIMGFNPQTRRFDIQLGLGQPSAPIIKEITTPEGTTLAQMVPSLMRPGSLMAQRIEGAGVRPLAPPEIKTITVGVEGKPGVTTTMQLLPDTSGRLAAQPITGVVPKTPTPKTGQQIVQGPDGTLTITTGVTGADLEKPTKKAIEGQILETTKTLSSLDQIDSLYDPSFLQIPTQLSNYVDLTMEKLTGIPPENADALVRYAQFRAATQELFSTILKQLSGAAVTRFELENAKTFLPDKSDSPTVFKAKVDNLRTISRAALYRAQQLRAGNDKITEDLAKKYPLSLKAPSGDTVYIDQFVDKYMSMAAEQNVAATQEDALKLWAEKARAA